jgi:nitrous oxide reductase accessory protein NosL
MRRRLTAAVVAALAAVLLAGCHDDEERPDPIEEGIRCSEAGGSWEYSDWSGYHCEFEPKAS